MEGLIFAPNKQKFIIKDPFPFCVSYSNIKEVVSMPLKVLNPNVLTFSKINNIIKLITLQDTCFHSFMHYLKFSFDFDFVKNLAI